MKLLKYLGFSSLLFFPCQYICILLAVNQMDSLIHVTYNYANHFVWGCMYFYIPTLVSLLGGFIIFQNYSKSKLKKIFEYWGILNLILLLTTNVTLAIHSKMYWGYYFKRPVIFEQVKAALEIENASEVHTINVKDQKQFLIDKEPKKQILLGRVEPYYWNEDRIFMTFESRHTYRGNLTEWNSILNDSSQSISDCNLVQIRDIIYRDSFIENGSGNYFTHRDVFGPIVEFTTDKGDRFIYAGLRSDQIANDHYPFYEFLFAEENGKLKMLKRQKYYFDDAGREYEEFSFWEPVILILLTLVELIAFALIILIRYIKRIKYGIHQ